MVQCLGCCGTYRNIKGQRSSGPQRKGCETARERGVETVRVRSSPHVCEHVHVCLRAPSSEMPCLAHSQKHRRCHTGLLFFRTPPFWDALLRRPE